MTHQTSFSHAEFAAKKKTTRREKFLARMEEVIPWKQLLAVIEPHYPKGERGRPPVGLERMLRMYFLQQWYGLADEALEDALQVCLRLLLQRRGIGIRRRGQRPEACRRQRRRVPAAVGCSGDWLHRQLFATDVYAGRQHEYGSGVLFHYWRTAAIWPGRPYLWPYNLFDYAGLFPSI